MVVDEELKPQHELTKHGEEVYKKFLEQKADEILFRDQHPLVWAYKQIKSWFKKED